MAFEGLLVGLGNPGRKYATTRHNFGFMVVDHLLGSDRRGNGQGALQSLSSGRDHDLWRWNSPQGDWLVTRPLTYMNLSGRAVGHICRYYGLEPEQVLVLHDELDLPLGRMKMKFEGGLAGHKGLISIFEHLGSKSFYRLRLGIGRPPEGQDVSSYVLRPFSASDARLVELVLDHALAVLRTFLDKGFQPALQMANSFEGSDQGTDH